jgi:hypothetical protein
MILGHDFKYQIPEMDRILGAAADMGIHFTYDSEDVSDTDRGKYLIQIVMEKTRQGSIQLVIGTFDVVARGKTE